MQRGGARPGAGRPKKSRPLPKAYIALDGKGRDFLYAVLRDPEADFHARFKAACELLPYEERRLSPLPLDAGQLPLPLPEPGAEVSPERAAWEKIVH